MKKTTTVLGVGLLICAVLLVNSIIKLSGYRAEIIELQDKLDKERLSKNVSQLPSEARSYNEGNVSEELVKELSRLEREVEELKKFKFFPDFIDSTGYYGPITNGAVKNYQASVK